VSRICLVCVSLRAGGTERIVSRIANHLCERHDVIILLLSRTTPFYELRQEVSIIQPELSRRGEAGWRWYPQMLRHLWQGFTQARPDLVLCFGEPIAPVVLPVARLQCRRTMVFNRASPLTSLRGLRGLLNPPTYPLAHRVVVQTNRSVELLRRRYRLSRFAVLPNPVDLPESVSSIDQREQRILNVGTLGAKKNQQALIQTFAACESPSGWSLEFVGDGPDRPALEGLCDRLGLDESVRFLGQRSDVSDLLHDSRIFAFTSLTEGFPNALAEAMAAGCACISYDCPTGPSELIEHGVNGFLVEPGDEVEYRRLLQQLIDDADLRARFSHNARKSMERFEAGVVMDKLEGLIEETVDGKRVNGSVH